MERRKSRGEDRIHATLVTLARRHYEENRWYLISIFLLQLHGSVSAAESRPMVPKDYYRLTFVSTPRISPDNTEVVFVAARVSEDRRSRETSLWLVATSGEEPPVRLTAGLGDSHPRWSPDGSRIAFLRLVTVSEEPDAKKKAQVFELRRAGGEAQPLTTIEGGVSSFSWSPDGRSLLIERRTESACRAEQAESEEPTTEEAGGDDNSEARSEEPKPDVRVIRDAFYKKNDRGYLDAKRTHFWLLDIESEALRQLTAEASWNDENPSFSADGSRLVFDSDHSGDEFDGGSNDDLWVIAIDDETAGDEMPEPRRLTDHPHTDSTPRWSPDGRWIAYLHTEKSFEQTEILILPAAGGEPRTLTVDFDRQPSNLHWSTDSRALFFTAADHGANRLFRLDIDSGQAQPLLGDGISVGDLEAAPAGDWLAFTLHNETLPAEVWVATPDGSEARRLTGLNDKLLAELELGGLEAVRFENEAGMPVEGFVLAPLGLKKGATYPLVLNIKGGPGGMWGHAWMHEFQMLAGKGWGVAFVNYRGSTGYGAAHEKAVRLDYGGADYRDNMQFLDTVLERFDWINRDRLFVTGGSHGGFLTNWILTRTNRFRAAVTQRSVASWLSEAGTQQYTPREMREEFGGSLWENFDLYWDRSPIRFANRIKTPTLILHSDEDHICPIGQAQAFFYALKAHGVETEMVIFRGENHSLSRDGTPVNLVERLRRIIDWFERHL